MKAYKRLKSLPVASSVYTMLYRLATIFFLVLEALAAQVQLGATSVIGMDLPLLGQEFFGGIPFAEAPRLKPPVLKTSLDSATFDATSFGPACLQPAGTFGIVDISEDCLTINIFRPSGIPSGVKLPVMAWIYGGGFYGGGASIYNASALVAQSVIRGTPVIYVSFNYRLGPLGFPAGHEAESKGALNLGLKDQLAALKWIQLKIAAFGGDKSKVTVFGESAGAVSIGVLFLNNGLDGLARAAIFHSGSAATSLTFTAGRRQNVWDDFVGFVPECSEIATTSKTFQCLQNVNSSELVTAAAQALSVSGEQFPWNPTLDGAGGVFPDLPSKLYAKGHFSKIPFIAGTNLDEGTDFTTQTINSSTTIREWLVKNYTAGPGDVPLLQAAATQILYLYPDIPALGSPFGTGEDLFGLDSQYKRLAAITGDLLFQSLRRRWTNTAALHGIKNYGYLFTDRAAPIVIPATGVAHGLDLLYLYGFLPLIPGISNASLELAIRMADYWISFATSLDPNDGLGTSRPLWPQYDAANPMLLQLQGNSTKAIPDNYRAQQIAFINSHAALFRH
ncbi:esterase 1 [Mycena floridula]|nr:esterase 1 [Mycena floridula]